MSIFSRLISKEKPQAPSAQEMPTPQKEKINSLSAILKEQIAAHELKKNTVLPVTNAESIKPEVKMDAAPQALPAYDHDAEIAKREAEIKKLEEKIAAEVAANPAKKETAEENIPGPIEEPKWYGGRELVTAFLQEFDDLLKAGNTLQENERKVTDAQNNLLLFGNESKAWKVAKEDVADKITDLFAGREGKSFEEVFASAQKSFENATQVVEDEFKKKYKIAEGEKNKFLIELNTKKNHIKRLFGELGGPEVVENVKNIIKKAESIAKDAILKYQEGAGKDVSEKTIDSIHRACIKEITTDPHGTMLLVQSGNILDVMIKFFGEDKYKDNIKKAVNDPKNYL